MKKALFLDQDNTLIKDFVYNVTKIEFVEKTLAFILQEKYQDFLKIIVTNQSGIRRKKFSQQDLHHFQEKLLKECTERGLYINKIYYCPHIPEDDCECRKPGPGLISNALSDFDIDLRNSLFIGDNWSDYQCAKKNNIPFIFSQDIP